MYILQWLYVPMKVYLALVIIDQGIVGLCLPLEMRSKAKDYESLRLNNVSQCIRKCVSKCIREYVSKRVSECINKCISKCTYK